MSSSKIFTARYAILWSCVFSVTCVTTFSQVRFLKESPPRQIAPYLAQAPRNGNVEAEFSASALENYITVRSRTLADLGKPDMIGAGANSKATYLTRPSVQIRSILILGDKRAAVIAVEGEKKTVVVQPGDDLSGIKIVAIEPNGINCEWREQKFFVPIN